MKLSCQFILRVERSGIKLCGEPAAWRNDEPGHERACFCELHKQHLEAVRCFGGEWVRLTNCEERP